VIQALTQRIRGQGDRLGRPALSTPVLLVGPAVVFLLVLFVWPVLLMGLRSVTEPPGVALGNYFRFVETDPYVRILISTVRTAGLATIICLVLGYPYAYVMHIASPRLAGILLILVLVPFWSSLLVRTYAWTVILRDTGIINSLLLDLGLVAEPVPLIRTQTGVLIGMTQILLPFMVLPIYAVMRRIDPELGVAAANLGAGPITSFRRVFLPLSMLGVFAGCLVVFVLSLGFYITPVLLGSPSDAMISQAIATQVERRLDWGFAGAMGMILLGVTLVVLFIASRIIRVRDVFNAS
jgi:putative spermidine/putrescine transport system permease protein